MVNKIKRYFRKPEIEFNKPLTSADIVRMFKEKQFNGLKKLMPQFNWGGKRLSRSKSALVILGFVLGIGLFSTTGNPLPLLLSALSIAYGSLYSFDSGATDYISVSALDSSHFVVAYRDGADAKGYARIGTISSVNEIAYGSVYVFASATTATDQFVATLDSTHFVIVYRLGATGTAIIGTVSSVDEIAYGSAYQFVSAVIAHLSVSVLDATHFIAVYKDYSDANYYGTAIIGVVSSVNHIAYGNVAVFNSASTFYNSVSALDSSHFVVAYRDGADFKGYARIGTVSSGDEIAYGSVYVFNSAVTADISVSALDSSHFVVAYRDDGGSDYGGVKIGTIASVNQISYGSEYIFNSAYTNKISVSSLDSSHFVVGYKDEGGTDYGCAKIGTISSVNQVAYGSEYPFNSVTSDSISVSALDATHFVVGYRNASDLGSYAVIGTYTPPAAGPANVKSFNGVAIADIKSINGVAIADIKSINSVE